MKLIVTHQNPDWDAIASAWLLKRFGGKQFADAEIKFVNTGNPDAELIKQASSVVDTGKVYDAQRFRFDHHQFPGDEANITCATGLVFDWLLYAHESYGGAQAADDRLGYLAPLVELVWQGDAGRPEAKSSRDLGLHALLSAFKARDPRPTDDEILEFGFMLLDLMDGRLKHQAEAKAELNNKVVYKSDDGRLWAIKHGSTASTFAAYEEGATLVVFEGEPIEEGGKVVSYPIGVMRQGEATEPHVGSLIKAILHNADDASIADELSTWFQHNAGFFAGRGTGKALDPSPVIVHLSEVARLIDRAWQR